MLQRDFISFHSIKLYNINANNVNLAYAVNMSVVYKVDVFKRNHPTEWMLCASNDVNGCLL